MDKHCIEHTQVGYGLGYATAWLRLPDGTKKSTTLHRKVFYEATGQLPAVVRHKCDNPRCINIDHLEAGTQLDNVHDMIERKRQGDCRNFGTSNGRTILTTDDVAIIRSTYIKGSKSYGLPALAKRFNVGTSQIHRVVKGVHHA